MPTARVSIEFDDGSSAVAIVDEQEAMDHAYEFPAHWKFHYVDNNGVTV